MCVGVQNSNGTLTLTTEIWNLNKDVAEVLLGSGMSSMRLIPALYNVQPAECTPSASSILVDTLQRPSARHMQTSATAIVFCSLSAVSDTIHKAEYSHISSKVCQTE